MRVRVDQPRHDQFAFCVDGLPGRKTFSIPRVEVRRRSHKTDAVSAYTNYSVFNNVPRGIHGHNGCFSDDEVETGGTDLCRRLSERYGCAHHSETNQ